MVKILRQALVVPTSYKFRQVGVNRRINIPTILKILGTIGALGTSIAGCVSDDDMKLANPDPPASAPQADISVASVADATPDEQTQSKPHPSKTIKKQRKSHKPAPPADVPQEKVQEKVATMEPNQLIGKGPSGVVQLLGVPTSASQRDISLIWTYASSDCAFQVYFYPDIKTSLWHALQYASLDKNGEALNPSKLCIERILAEKSNGTN
jgi:hypothetical protein